jgi:hypothetical protein
VLETPKARLWITGTGNFPALFACGNPADLSFSPLMPASIFQFPGLNHLPRGGLTA